MDIIYGPCNIPSNLENVIDDKLPMDRECYIFILKSKLESISICYLGITSSIQSLTWNILDMIGSDSEVCGFVHISSYKEALHIVNTIRYKKSAINGWIRFIHHNTLLVEIVSTNSTYIS